MKSYAGIGSRDTPKNILDLMEWISKELYNANYTLRSGGAPGADQAFERALLQHKRYNSEKQVEIYLPWPGFESKNREGWFKAKRERPQKEAFSIAKKYHPNWDYLSNGVRCLHARNAHQILGCNIIQPRPVDFVVCWTKDGKASGGTGQALRIAADYHVKIYNLKKEKDLDEITDWILSNDFR